MKKIFVCLLLLIFTGFSFAQDLKTVDEKPFVLGVTHTVKSVELGEDRKLERFNIAYMGVIVEN